MIVKRRRRNSNSSGTLLQNAGGVGLKGIITQDVTRASLHFSEGKRNGSKSKHLIDANSSKHYKYNLRKGYTAPTTKSVTHNNESNKTGGTLSGVRRQLSTDAPIIHVKECKDSQKNEFAEIFKSKNGDSEDIMRSMSTIDSMTDDMHDAPKWRASPLSLISSDQTYPRGILKTEGMHYRSNQSCYNGFVKKIVRFSNVPSIRFY